MTRDEIEKSIGKLDAWLDSDKEVRDAFAARMCCKTYGSGALLQAFGWFEIGWSAGAKFAARCVGAAMGRALT